MININHLTIIGVMSGTSLDGLDIVKCHFFKGKNWDYTIEKGITIKYSDFWKKTLRNLHLKEQKEISKINIEYGSFIGNEINKFISNNNSKIDLIASHGHTIFHEPEKKLTLQIGDGQTISNISKCTTVSNFRALDVSLNGQGAPLVPIGDLHLFSKYKYCLNIGGFANISIKKNNSIIAYDICPANIILNHISNKINFDFDIDGKISASGKIDSQFLKKLNQISFYKKTHPKSLSREWLEKNILSLDEINNKKPNDLLATFCEHIGYQIGNKLKEKSVYITGGGAHNKFLISRIKNYSKSKIIIPDKLNVDYKEAMIFGFLGILKIKKENNCLKDVTGAIKDSCGGIIHNPQL